LMNPIKLEDKLRYLLTSSTTGATLDIRDALELARKVIPSQVITR
jgi:hypothetical protein